MSESPIDRLLPLLKNVRKSGDGWVACCPAHDDSNPSLGISLGRAGDGTVVVNCRSAGCSTEAIVKAVGMTVVDLFPSKNGTSHEPKPVNGKPRRPGYSTAKDAAAAIANSQDFGRNHDVSWTFTDEKGQPVAVELRWIGPVPGDKSEKPTRVISLINGQWHREHPPEPRPLYNLPAITGARRVIFTEGAKKAKIVNDRIGLVATAITGGSNAPVAKYDWKPLSQVDEFWIFRDNDEPGVKFANAVAAEVRKVNSKAAIKILMLGDDAPGSDIEQWIKARDDNDDPERMRADIEAIAAETKLWGDLKPPRFEFIDSQEFDAGDYSSSWLIPGVLTKGEPFGVIGLSKTLKTSICVDALVSMATGLPFLNTFKVQKPTSVALMSAESGKRTLQETARRICKAKGTSLDAIPKGRFSWCFDVPVLTDLISLNELGKILVDRGVVVLAIDPFYMTLGNADAKNLFEVGKVLVDVGRTLTDRGLTVGFLHHANRKSAPGLGKQSEPLELTDIAYSGLEQYVRQFFLLSRREKYQQDGNHKLFFKWGGSAGHGGLHDLDIYEGLTDENFQGRVWDVTMTKSTEAKAAAAEERDEKAKEKRRLKAESIKKDVLEAIDFFASKKPSQPATQNAIRSRAGINGPAFALAIEGLRQDDAITATTSPVGAGKGSKTDRTTYSRKGRPTPSPVLNFGDNEQPDQPDKSGILSGSPVDPGAGPINRTTFPCRGESVSPVVRCSGDPEQPEDNHDESVRLIPNSKPGAT